MAARSTNYSSHEVSAGLGSAGSEAFAALPQREIRVRGPPKWPKWLEAGVAPHQSPVSSLHATPRDDSTRLIPTRLAITPQHHYLTPCTFLKDYFAAQWDGCMIVFIIKVVPELLDSMTADCGATYLPKYGVSQT